MKAVYLIYDEALDSQVMNNLAAIGVEQYTKFTKLLGAGTHAEPHLNDLIWPGANAGLLILTDEVKKDKILAQFKALKQKHLKEGVKAFVWTVEEVL